LALIFRHINVYILALAAHALWKKRSN